MGRTAPVIILGLALVLAAPGSGKCQPSATATVEAHVNNVLKVLGNPALKGQKGEQEKRKEVMAEADKLFDFVELSKRTLGLAWNRFTMPQRKEFVSLYRQLLEVTYMDRLTAYAGEKVSFANQVPLDPNTVEVRSNVTTKTGPVGIYYRMLNENGQWRVYDVVIEGVSLIQNYRSQFRQILMNKDPAGLLDVLRQRVKEGPK